MDNILEVIDLTQSFTVEPTQQQQRQQQQQQQQQQRPRFRTNTVIDLKKQSHKSIVTVIYQPSPRPRKSKPSTTLESKDAVIIVEQPSNSPEEITSTPRERSPVRGTFGECPICYEALGKHPLASTKCGHVFCLSCLENSLKNVKKCPTCRKSLYGRTGYHRLFLGKN